MTIIPCPDYQTPEEASLQRETRDALIPGRMNGKLADVYLQFANSEPALRAYLLPAPDLAD